MFVDFGIKDVKMPRNVEISRFPTMLSYSCFICHEYIVTMVTIYITR